MMYKEDEMVVQQQRNETDSEYAQRLSDEVQSVDDALEQQGAKLRLRQRAFQLALDELNDYYQYMRGPTRRAGFANAEAWVADLYVGGRGRIIRTCSVLRPRINNSGKIVKNTTGLRRGSTTPSKKQMRPRRRPEWLVDGPGASLQRERVRRQP